MVSEKAKENEKELRKEISSAQKRVERAEKDSATQALLLKEAREENEKLKADLAEQRKQSAEIEAEMSLQARSGQVFAAVDQHGAT